MTINYKNKIRNRSRSRRYSTQACFQLPPGPKLLRLCQESHHRLSPNVVDSNQFALPSATKHDSFVVSCRLDDVTVIKFGLNALVLVLGWRSDNFVVGLTDVSPTITAPTLWNYDVCAQYPGAVGDGATVNLTCTSCMPARRYLIVQVELASMLLNFCEIEVYARTGKLMAVTIRSSQSTMKENNETTLQT